MWEKELPQWASAKVRLSTLNAGAAEEERTTCATNVVELAVTAKPKLCVTTLG